MVTIVGIQFRNASRVYYFAPNGNDFKIGEYAIVETVRGVELGKVIIPNRDIDESEVLYELKPVIRKASSYDVETDARHQEFAKKGFEVFKMDVANLNLPMKPLYCEYTIDSSKIIFYYSADDRVDFRELLKILAPKFKTRIELRQIGPREAARIVGGIGNCGRVICCSSCLNNFDYVTMKMAKEQGMSLNIAKISGLCGKLMCCIGYENELYAELKKTMPNVGDLVKTPKCACTKVLSVDYIKKIVSVEENKEGALVKYNASDVTKVVPKDPFEPDSIKVDVAEPSKDSSVEEAKSAKPQDNSKKRFDKKKPKDKGNNYQNNSKKQVFKKVNKNEDN